MDFTHVVFIYNIFDNHDSVYLRMVVQFYVQAHLGHSDILTQRRNTAENWHIFLPIHA